MFLSSHMDGTSSRKDPLTMSVRQKIMMARKIIIDNDFVPCEETTFTDPDLELPRTAVVMDMDYITKVVESHKDCYPVYAKMPFDLVFIESGLTGVLLEKIDDNSFSVLNLNLFSKTNPTSLDNECAAIPVLKAKVTNGDLSSMTPIIFNKKAFEKLTTDYTQRQAKNILSSNGQALHVQAFIALEVLVYLNTINHHVQIYKPTSKEVAHIPKPLHPKFEYWILDIFRDKKPVTSLAELPYAGAKDNEGRRQYRAHLVRGHYKTIRGKLYWWNAFTRCRKNAETAGVIEKDYHIVGKLAL